MGVEAAVAYARRHRLDALMVWHDGAVECEATDNGFDVRAPHALYSGTKSFWGPAAVLAQREGLLELDEPVCKTLTEWRGDARRERITPRMLLSLTAGYGFGGLGAAVPTYDRAIALPLKDDPGSTFTYGGIALQVFGAFFARKLAAQQLTPHRYLLERLLRPAQVEVASWRTLKDGTHPLPTGAFLTAAAWLTYGTYVCEQQTRFAECFAGSKANRRYGLGWWLGLSNAPADLVYASGSGGQGLYVIPSHKLVAVHFGNRSAYKHDAFVRALVG